MPDNIEKALNITIVTITAEREEKAIGRDERGLSTRVFAVGGSRESIPVNRGEYRPRGRNQWSNCRGGRSQNRSGRLQYSTGVDGTYSDRTDNRTSVTAWDTGGRLGGISVPKNYDDSCASSRPRGIICYNCGLEGHTRVGCPRGHKRNLNGIGRTKMTPPSVPK